jgi:hypothetical protein
MIAAAIDRSDELSERSEPVYLPKTRAPRGGPPTLEDGAFDLEGFERWAKIGRTQVFKEAKAGRLIVTKVGRRSIVTYANAKAWLASLPTRQVA